MKIVKIFKIGQFNKKMIKILKKKELIHKVKNYQEKDPNFDAH